jgi:hypothetical protein
MDPTYASVWSLGYLHVYPRYTHTLSHCPDNGKRNDFEYPRWQNLTYTLLDRIDILYIIYYDLVSFGVRSGSERSSYLF